MLVRGLLFLSMALYVACLPMDAICLSSCSDWPGYGALIVGALDVVGVSLSNLIWLANPALFVSWILIWRRRRARLAQVLAGIALVLAVSFMLAETIVASTSGMPSKITGLAIGYWFWLVSIAAACGAAAMQTIVPEASTAKG